MKRLLLLSGLMMGLAVVQSGCSTKPGAELEKETVKYDSKTDGMPVDMGGPGARGTAKGKGGKGPGAGVKP